MANFVFLIRLSNFLDFGSSENSQKTIKAFQEFKTISSKGGSRGGSAWKIGLVLCYGAKIPNFM